MTADDSRTDEHSDDVLMTADDTIDVSSTNDLLSAVDNDDILWSTAHGQLMSADDGSIYMNDVRDVFNLTDHSLNVGNIPSDVSCENCSACDSDEVQDPLICALTENRKKHGKSLVIAHINVNGLGEKRDYFRDILLQGLIDVLCVSESKLSPKYVQTDLNVNGFKAHRKDRKSNSGGLHIWIRADIPHDREKHLEFSHTAHIENMVISMTIRKEKWLLVLAYKNPRAPKAVFIDLLCKQYNTVIGSYKEIVLLGDVNIDMQKGSDVMSQGICHVYGVKNIITKPTCFKTESGTLIDPIIVLNNNRFHKPINTICGFSDWHNMVCCTTKLAVPPSKPRKIQYRSYKHFNEDKFMNDVSNIPFSVCNVFDDVDDKYWSVSVLYNDVVNENAPLKQRTLRNDQIPYMHSELRKQMYRRNMAKNKHLENRKSVVLRYKYVVERNKTTSMRREAIKAYFLSKCSKMASPRDFWQCVRPFLSDKGSKQNNIILNENGCIKTDTKEVCDIFNAFFSTVAESIGEPDEICLNEHNYLQKVLTKHENHPSVTMIKDVCNITRTFDFKPVTRGTVLKLLKNVNVNKSTGHDNIPPKLLKMAGEEMCDVWTSVINSSINSRTFPSEMKKAEISPIYKKLSDMLKENFRPVSILATLSKIFESIIADQLMLHFNDIFNEYLCAYRKKYGCQHALIKLVESWKKAFDNKECIGVLLMDLSKAFDCVPHCLLVCKLKAYGLSDGACVMMCSYLSGRYQRVKIDSYRSEWVPLKKGIPQGSCLGPLIFNIFVNDLFLFIEKCMLINYADDNTLSYSAKTFDVIMDALRFDTKNAIKWFTMNYMQANPDKFQVMIMKPICNRQDIPGVLDIDGVQLQNQSDVKLLGITLDCKLQFNKHISNICERASRQLNVLSRFKNIFSTEEKKTMYKAFILANFGYCPIVWHFCGETNTRKMERIQERALRFMYNDLISDYNGLLNKAGMETLHLKRLKVLATEVFKSINDLNPSFMQRMFTVKVNSLGLRDENKLVQPQFDTITYGKRCFTYYGAHLWNLMPENVKGCINMYDFKQLLSSWEGPGRCQCNLCDITFT